MRVASLHGAVCQSKAGAGADELVKRELLGDQI